MDESHSTHQQDPFVTFDQYLILLEIKVPLQAASLTYKVSKMHLNIIFSYKNKNQNYNITSSIFLQQCRKSPNLNKKNFFFKFKKTKHVSKNKNLIMQIYLRCQIQQHKKLRQEKTEFCYPSFHGSRPPHAKYVRQHRLLHFDPVFLLLQLPLTLR